MATHPFSKIDIDGSTDKDEYFVESHRPDEESFERKVLDLLDVIAANPVGAIVLTHIKDDDDDLIIVPYTDQDIRRNNNDHCNALTGVAKDARVRDSHPEGEYYWNWRYEKGPDGNQVHRPYEQYKLTGTGKGTDAKVHFTPDIWGGAACGKGVYATEPDVVLVHELIHGIRNMEGHVNLVPTAGKLLGYDDEEEFLAIVVANVYIGSKWNGTASGQLRADHHGHTALQPPLNTSRGFLEDGDNRSLLRKLRDRERGLFDKLAMVDCEFNPFLEMKVIRPLPGATLKVAVPKRPPDPFLLPIVQPRYDIKNEAGWRGQIQRLERELKEINRVSYLFDIPALIGRLEARIPGDKLSEAFHDNLDRRVRARLIQLLKDKAM